MIVRTVKDKTNPYYLKNRRSAEDTRLSFKARGILDYLLSKPDHWEANIDELVKAGPDGKAAVRAGVDELIKFGYIARVQVRKDGKIAGWRLDTYETPELNPWWADGSPIKATDHLDTENRNVDELDTDFQDVENQEVENRTHSKYSIVVSNERKVISKSGGSNSTRQLAPEPVQPEPAPAPKKRGRVTSSDIDPRKLVGGMIPAGTGTTPVEVHREFFDWSIPAEGLSRFNCQVITDEVKDLAKWRETCRAWAEKGYRGGNREGLQDWYRNQHTTRKAGGNATSRSEKPVEGWHAGLIKKWEPEKRYTDEEIDRWLDTLEDRTQQPVMQPVHQRTHQSAAD